jgi:hypothetical protein
MDCLRATNVVAAGMKNAPWQGANGVITEGASPDVDNDDVYFKGAFSSCTDRITVSHRRSRLGSCAQRALPGHA